MKSRCLSVAIIHDGFTQTSTYEYKSEKSYQSFVAAVTLLRGDRHTNLRRPPHELTATATLLRGDNVIYRNQLSTLVLECCFD